MIWVGNLYNDSELDVQLWHNISMISCSLSCLIDFNLYLLLKGRITTNMPTLNANLEPKIILPEEVLFVDQIYNI